MKNNPLSILSIIVLIFGILSCKNLDNQSNNQNTSTVVREQPTKYQSESFDKDVVLTFKIETSSSRKPKITGETNLPNGTELMFSIEGKSVRYNGQDKSKVSNGSFESSTFSSNYNDLLVGQYEAEVLMPIAEVQPPTVRAVIGEKGEKLKGSIVKNGDLGVTIAVKQLFYFNADNSVTSVTNESKPITGKATSTSNSEVKPLINFFSLANKSVDEIEEIYGKALFADKKSVQFKDGEFRHYKMFDEKPLQIDYYKGKAVAFYLDISQEMQSKNPEDILKLCGLNVQLTNAQSEQTGYWWDNPSEANPFYRVRISRFNDSGLYYHCEVHLKVS